MTEPNETGFEGRLRALAATIMLEDAPGFNCHDSLFRALRFFAAIKGFGGTPEDMAACEAFGRVKVSFFKERRVI